MQAMRGYQMFLLGLQVKGKHNLGVLLSDTTNGDGGPFGNGVMDPFQEAQARQPHVKDPYKLFGPICMELSNPGMIRFTDLGKIVLSRFGS